MERDIAEGEVPDRGREMRRAESFPCSGFDDRVAQVDTDQPIEAFT